MTHDERWKRREAMAGACKAGELVKDVAGRFGVTKSCVTEACGEFGVILRKPAIPRLRKPRLRSVFTFGIVAALQNTNDTGLAIAAQFGIRSQWVYEILKRARKAGIKFPNRDGKEEAFCQAVGELFAESVRRDIQSPNRDGKEEE